MTRTAAAVLDRCNVGALAVATPSREYWNSIQIDPAALLANAVPHDAVSHVVLSSYVAVYCSPLPRGHPWNSNAPGTATDGAMDTAQCRNPLTVANSAAYVSHIDATPEILTFMEDAAAAGTEDDSQSISWPLLHHIKICRPRTGADTTTVTDNGFGTAVHDTVFQTPTGIADTDDTNGAGEKKSSAVPAVPDHERYVQLLASLSGGEHIPELRSIDATAEGFGVAVLGRLYSDVPELLRGLRALHSSRIGTAELLKLVPMCPHLHTLKVACCSYNDDPGYVSGQATPPTATVEFARHIVSVVQSFRSPEHCWVRLGDRLKAHDAAATASAAPAAPKSGFTVSSTRTAGGRASLFSSKPSSTPQGSPPRSRTPVERVVTSLLSAISGCLRVLDLQTVPLTLPDLALLAVNAPSLNTLGIGATGKGVTGVDVGLFVRAILRRGPISARSETGGGRAGHVPYVAATRAVEDLIPSACAVDHLRLSGMHSAIDSFEFLSALLGFPPHVFIARDNVSRDSVPHELLRALIERQPASKIATTLAFRCQDRAALFDALYSEAPEDHSDEAGVHPPPTPGDPKAFVSRWQREDFDSFMDAFGSSGFPALHHLEVRGVKSWPAMWTAALLSRLSNVEQVSLCVPVENSFLLNAAAAFRGLWPAAPRLKSFALSDSHEAAPPQPPRFVRDIAPAAAEAPGATVSSVAAAVEAALAVPSPAVGQPALRLDLARVNYGRRVHEHDVSAAALEVLLDSIGVGAEDSALEALDISLSQSAASLDVALVVGEVERRAERRAANAKSARAPPGSPTSGHTALRCLELSPANTATVGVCLSPRLVRPLSTLFARGESFSSLPYLMPFVTYWNDLLPSIPAADGADDAQSSDDIRPRVIAAGLRRLFASLQSCEVLALHDPTLSRWIGGGECVRLLSASGAVPQLRSLTLPFQLGLPQRPVTSADAAPIRIPSDAVPVACGVAREIRCLREHSGPVPLSDALNQAIKRCVSEASPLPTAPLHIALFLGPLLELCLNARRLSTLALPKDDSCPGNSLRGLPATLVMLAAPGVTAVGSAGCDITRCEQDDAVLTAILPEAPPEKTTR